MKKSLLVSTGLMILSLNVASASGYVPQVSCEDAEVVADYGFNVEISKYSGPIVQFEQVTPSLSATISEEGIAGPHVVGTYEVNEEQSPAIGAPKYYKGKNFELELLVDAAPVDGKVRAHLTAETNQGKRVSEEMLCTFVNVIRPLPIVRSDVLQNMPKMPKMPK